MKLRVCLLSIAVLMWWPQAEHSVAAAAKPYVVLDKDLQRLKDDFNAKIGSVRLLFIIGPTCGICLRGMADLNDELLAKTRNDPRLQTFAVYVPTLGAAEKHVIPASQLMQGPRIYHYWDGAGTIGLLYTEVLDSSAYAWDVWLAYGPGAVWEDTTPPKPDFWQHQLPSLPEELRLDKKSFAAKTLAAVNKLDIDDFNPTPVAPNENPLADGAVIPWVGQGHGRAIDQYEESHGGLAAIHAVRRREYRGKLTIGDKSFDLIIIEQRPNKIEKRIPEANYIIRYDGGESVERHGHLPHEGLPLKIEAHLMGYFDFDTPLIDWNKKGHKFAMEGMEKLGGVLAWNLVQTDPDGRKWTYLINSHSGLIERVRAYDDSGALMVSVYYSDYRDVEGMPVAYRLDYRGPDGKTFAVETFTEVHASGAAAGNAK